MHQNGKRLGQADLVNKLNEHFKGSTKIGNVVTTADGKYNIIVDENVNISVEKYVEEVIMPGDVALTYNLLTNPDRIQLNVEVLGMPEYDMINLFKVYLDEEWLPGMTADQLLVLGGELMHPGAGLNEETVYNNTIKSNLDDMPYAEFQVNGDAKVQELLGYPSAAAYIKFYMLGSIIDSSTLYNLVENAAEMVYSKQLLPELVEKGENEIISTIEGYYNPKKTFDDILIEIASEIVGNDTDTMDGFMGGLNQGIPPGYEQLNFFNREQALIYLAGKAYANTHQLVVEYPDGSTDKIDWFANSDMKFSKNYTMTDASEYNFKVTGPSGKTRTITYKISSITLDKTEILKENILSETTETITATVENIDGNLTWESSNPNIAQISGEGNTRTITIKPIEGEATISVSYQETKSKCKIIVRDNNSETIAQTIEATGNFANNPSIKEVRQGNIPIPTGFTYMNGSVLDGAVVQAPDGSEFVWIPVENAVYNSSHENVSKIPTSSTNGSLNGYDYTPMGIKVSSEYKGLLYDFNSTGGAYLMYPNATNYQGDSGGNREPDYLLSADPDEGINLLSEIVKIEGDVNTAEGQKQILDTWKTQLQNEYKEMIESVEKYGGFYVGRYVTSLKVITKEDGTKEEVAQVKSGIRAATAARDSANTWYGLYQKQKEYSEKNDLTNIVGSTMIWGSQYDQVMIWMQKNDVDVTGTTQTDVMNNIYDMNESEYEGTLEARNINCRVHRGGNGGNSSSPSDRNNGIPPYSTNSYYCSRSSLYIR